MVVIAVINNMAQPKAAIHCVVVSITQGTPGWQNVLTMQMMARNFKYISFINIGGIQRKLAWPPRQDDTRNGSIP